MSENTCRVCGESIRVMINRGSGVCSENCRKIDNRQKEGAK